MTSDASTGLRIGCLGRDHRYDEGTGRVWIEEIGLVDLAVVEEAGALRRSTGYWREVAK